MLAVDISPDGTKVLAGSADGMAWLWERTTGKLKWKIQAHPQSISALAFSPNGEMLVTGSADGSARLCDAASGKSLGEPMTHQGPITVVAFLKDGLASSAYPDVAAPELPK